MNYRNYITAFFVIVISTSVFGQCPLNQSLSGLEITTANYTVQNTITSIQTIQPSANVSYVAGSKITLSSGFHAKTGSTFHASISPCTSKNNLPQDVVAQEEVSTKVERFTMGFDEEINVNGEDDSSSVSITTNSRSGNLASLNSLSCQPNPFQNSTTIVFELEQATESELSLFNLNGQKIKVLVAGQLEKGVHEYQFTADGLASGVYFARLIMNEEVLSVKMVLAK